MEDAFNADERLIASANKEDAIKEEEEEEDDDDEVAGLRGIGNGAKGVDKEEEEEEEDEDAGSTARICIDVIPGLASGLYSQPKEVKTLLFTYKPA
jgi:hypothetical protein